MIFILHILSILNLIVVAELIIQKKYAFAIILSLLTFYNYINIEKLKQKENEDEK